MTARQHRATMQAHCAQANLHINHAVYDHGYRNTSTIIRVCFVSHDGDLIHLHTRVWMIPCMHIYESWRIAVFGLSLIATRALYGGSQPKSHVASTHDQQGCVAFPWRRGAVRGVLCAMKLNCASTWHGSFPAAR